MDAVTKLPVEAGVLSRARRLFFFLTLNRIQIGSAILVILLFIATFIDDTNTLAHKRIHLLELFVMIVTGATGGGLISAALFHTNEYHAEKMVAEITEKSGEMPAFDPFAPTSPTKH